MPIDQNRQPNTRSQNPQPVSQHIAAGATLGELVRIQYGREGVKRYLVAINPLIPYDALTRIADLLGEAAPPECVLEQARPKPEEKPKSPAMNPEQMLLLMQALGGGEGGLDPKLLLKLLQ